MHKPFLAPLAALSFTLALTSTAYAQATKVTNADFLGVSLQTPAADVMSILRKNYPKLQLEITNYTITNAGTALKFNDGYKAQLETHLAPAERSSVAIAINNFRANALPDGSIIGLQREITFNPNQQTLQPLIDGLVAKYGEPTFLDKGNGQSMVTLLWSDKMVPGQRRKDANPNGNVGGTPYYKCSTEIAHYAGISYDPSDLFNGLATTNTRLYVNAQAAKECGTILLASLVPASGNGAYANTMTLQLANLADAPERVRKQSQDFTARVQAATAQKQQSDAKNVPKF
ncbi:hypothetical protein [Variovorax sp. tm]|uniref:hypothetical protein n=1 Tax=Variovorax atrisoli TaxID=3394203 RepID=UPI003A811837